MVNKAKMKKIMKQFTPKRANISSIGGVPLELPNHSRGKGPESDKGLANKKYVDDQFPVTHASTTGQTTDDHHNEAHTHTHVSTTGQGGDDHHVEFTTTEHSAIGDSAPHHVKAVSGDIDHDATVNTHNLTTDIVHDNITSGTIADHDTSATGTELNTLTDNSMADALHRHSELSASDGTPDAILKVGATGLIGIGTTSTVDQLEIGQATGGRILVSDAGGAARKGFLFHAPGTTNAYGRLLTYDYGGAQGVKLRINDTGGDVTIGNVTSKIGIGTVNPTIKLDVNTKSGHTAIGGIAIKLTNETGGNTVAGQVVIADPDVDDAFNTAGNDSENAIGIVLEAGVSDGSEAWIVVSGIADVYIGEDADRGDRIIAGAVGGEGDVWNVGGAIATHFREVGHCIENTGGAGLARCVLHFN